MNFQAVNVAQKDPNGGYVDADGSPSALLQDALDIPINHRQDARHPQISSGTTRLDAPSGMVLLFQ